MTRDITTAVETEVQAQVVEPFLLAELEFDSDPVNVWNGVGTLTWNGTDYTGVGDLGGIDPIGETSSIQARGIAFSLSGVPSATISLALGSNYSGRIARLRLGFFHTEYTTDQSVTVADDATSNDNDGTLVNGPTWTSDGPTDRIRGALSFDGVDDHVDLADIDGLETAFTAELWFKPNTSASGGSRIIVGKNDEFLIRHEQDDAPAVFVRDTVDGSYEPRAIGSVMAIGSWVHIALSWDGSNLELVQNGFSEEVETGAGSFSDTGNIIKIGQGTGDPVDGEVTDLRIWNVARTQTEIQNNMNTRLSGTETGLVGYWPLDDGVIERGEIIKDPFVIAEGFMDQLDIMEEGETSQVTVKAESRLITLQRAREFLYDHEDQQAIYPGDKGFEFVPALRNKEISWGVGTGRANAPFRTRRYTR